MQHEVVKEQPLLDRHGRIIEEGWARRPLWSYNRRDVHASALRIKEWDYYAVMSHGGHFCLAATLSDLGYAGMFALAFIDLTNKKAVQVDALQLLPLGKVGLKPDSGDYSIAWANERLRLAFSRKGEKRRLLVAAPDMMLPDGSVGLDADLTVHQDPNTESINIATSWAENRKAFYLNEKVNCMPTEGIVRLGKRDVEVKANDSYTVLDWGRGRWTYTNRWYWGSLSTTVDGVPFGFNIGYGFSDRSPASENALFYGGKIHKLDQVTFNIPASGYCDPWTFTSNDGRFEMDFRPIVDRFSSMNLVLVKTVQHQVFGTFSGKAVLDDGQKIILKDVYGFAEDVYNRY